MLDILTSPLVRFRRRMHPRFLGYGLALLSTATLSTAFVISKAALEVVNSESFTITWYTAATVYALAYGWVSGNMASRAALRQQWKPLASIGLINTLCMLLFYTQIKLTDPALVSFFGRMATLFTVTLGVVVLGERMRRREWAGAAVILAGALLITYHADQVVLTVFFMAIASSFLYASTMIIAKQTVDATSPLTLTLARASGTAGLVLIFALATGRWHPPPPDILIMIAVGALGGPLISHILLYRALSLIEASKVSLVGATQPAFVLFYSLLLFGSLPLAHQIAGGLLSMGGVAILISARNQR